MNFYETLEHIIEAPSAHEKCTRFETFYQAYQEDRTFKETTDVIKVFTHPSYEAFCNVVPPQVVPKRKNLATDQGKIILVHAVAHIEFTAIDMALDAAYRYREMPTKFYDDWLSVANDEVRHFKMLDQLLDELGAQYGDIDVHNALFDAIVRTPDLLERMAIVPRYLEANGLDATPVILTKLQRLKHDVMAEKIVKNLEIILHEEVDHVSKGDYWFKYVCEKQGCDVNVYFDIVDKYYPNTFTKRSRVLNVAARKAAGFSCSELNTMSTEHIC